MKYCKESNDNHNETADNELEIFEKLTVGQFKKLPGFAKTHLEKCYNEIDNQNMKYLLLKSEHSKVSEQKRKLKISKSRLEYYQMIIIILLR